MDTFHCFPLFVEDGLYKLYYYNFYNDSLWPLVHLFPELVAYEMENYAAYKVGNLVFVDGLMEIYEEETFSGCTTST